MPTVRLSAALLHHRKALDGVRPGRTGIGRRSGMKQRHMGARLWGSLFGCLLCCLCLVPTAGAQQTGGTVSVTVMDSSGLVVPGAQLTLTDLATNDART